MRYKFTVTIDAEGRKALIKSLRAHALYLEDEITDEELEVMAITGQRLPGIETIRIEGLGNVIK